MAVPIRARLGALQERDFRLLFAATTVTTFGDALGGIALAFAVLELPGATATDLGIVLAARQGMNVVVLLAGGVLSDRLPRNLVLAGAATAQGSIQALTAALVLTGNGSVASLVLLQALYGAAHGLLIPAEVGLVPQTVSAARLQQANALQGLSRNIVFVLGPAVGGVLVVAGSPGVALAADSASFFVCAVLLQRIRVPRIVRERAGFFHELREGWQEFASRTWLWSSVLLFGLANFVWTGCISVLGPTIAKDELGGAGAWATILAASGIGSIVGGVVAMRIRPSRPLLVSVLAPAPFVLQLVALAVVAPVWVLAATSFAVGFGLALHLALWFTVFQREVPEHAQSRVSSYDALGSFVLIPLGMAVVGPTAHLIGVPATLWIAAAVQVVCLAAIAAIPSVRAIRAPAPVASPA